MAISKCELRIGNYHHYHIVDPLDERGEYDEVCQIDPDDFRILTEFDCPEYKPIPLTEEWLKGFGFFEEKSFYERGIHNAIFSGCMRFKFDKLTQKWRFDIGTYKDITRVEYVHQLQNLFYALTGEELK